MRQGKKGIGRCSLSPLRGHSCHISIRRPIIFERKNEVKVGRETEAREIERGRGKRQTVVEEASHGTGVGQLYPTTDPDRLETSKRSGHDNWRIAASRRSTCLPVLNGKKWRNNGELLTEREEEKESGKRGRAASVAPRPLSAREIKRFYSYVVKQNTPRWFPHRY